MNAADDEDNHPWDWIDEMKAWFWAAVFMAAAAAFIGIALAGFFATFIQ